MTNQKPIEFQPNLARGRGGQVTIHVPMTGAEIEQLYLTWLVNEHPELKGEISYDAVNKRLYVGYWDIDVTSDEVVAAIDFELVGDTETEEDPSVDIEAFKAPVADVLAASPAASPLNPVDVRSILDPTTKLDVVQIHDKATVMEATQFAQASALPTQSTVVEAQHSGSFVDFTPNTGVVNMSPQPAINRESRPTPRLFIKNEPERQPTRGQRPSNFSEHESTTMGKPTRREQYDDQPHGGNKKSRRDFSGTKRDDRAGDSGQSNSERRDQRAAPKASPEMVARLLAGGIGSAVSSVDTAAFAQSFRAKTQQEHRRLRDEDFVDGETCINVSPSAETELGKALRLGEQRPFAYPNLGNFQSLAALYLVLVEVPGTGYAGFHTTRAYKELARQYDYRQELEACCKMSREDILGGVKGRYDLRAIYAIMGDALWAQINSDAALVTELLNNDLDFEAYLWVPKRGADQQQAEGSEQQAPAMKLRHERYGYWYLPLLREVVNTLRARLRGLEQGKPVEKLPLPNFNGPFEQAIRRLRRSMMFEVERRWEDAERTRVDNEQRRAADKVKRDADKAKARAERRQQQPSWAPKAQIDPDTLPNGPVNEAIFGKQAAAVDTDTVGNVVAETPAGPRLVVDNVVSENGTIEGQPASENSWSGTVSDTVVDPNVDLSSATFSKIEEQQVAVTLTPTDEPTTTLPDPGTVLDSVVAAPAASAAGEVVEAGIGLSTEPVGSVNVDSSLISHGTVELTLNGGQDQNVDQPVGMALSLSVGGDGNVTINSASAIAPAA